MQAGKPCQFDCLTWKIWQNCRRDCATMIMRSLARSIGANDSTTWKW
uniref:Uncharacterized protein n=1 Tax=Arundo donax TaxID=35708 RepID=A0A0A8YEQ2_ARUDO